MAQGTIWNILGMIGLTPWTQGSFFYFLGRCLFSTSQNTRWMDIHKVFRIWTQEAICYTVSQLVDCFTLFKLGVAGVCALGVHLVVTVTVSIIIIIIVIVVIIVIIVFIIIVIITIFIVILLSLSFLSCLCVKGESHCWEIMCSKLLTTEIICNIRKRISADPFVTAYHLLLSHGLLGDISRSLYYTINIYI